MAGVEEVEVLFKFTNPSLNVKELLLSNRKYLDGVAVRSEDLIEKVLNYLSDLRSEGLRPSLLIKYYEKFNDVLVNYVKAGPAKVYLELSDPSQINSLPNELANTVLAGIKLMHPAPNISRLARLGVKFIVMPPALIRGRVVREATARRITLIADTVNDASTFIKLAEAGVKVVVTDDPAIKRDAKKLVKL